MANVELPDYKPNSRKYHMNQSNGKVDSQERKLEKVVTGRTTAKKQSTGKRILNQFIEEDISDVKSYVLKEILLPSAKKMVYEMITSATGMTLGVDMNRKKTNNGFSSMTNYNAPYSSYSTVNMQPRRNDVYDYDNISFSLRGDAERVLQALKQEIYDYGSVSVAQLFSFADQPTRSTDFDYGWTSLTDRNSGTVRNRDGSYSISLPRAIPINGI